MKKIQETDYKKGYGIRSFTNPKKKLRRDEYMVLNKQKSKFIFL